MKLEHITPLVLTYNEEPNIRRCLERLQWASRVVVIDSGSSDRTLALCAAFPNVEVMHRDFDNHTNQWNFALDQSKTRWVLSLDADYIVSDAFMKEIEGVDAHGPVRVWFGRFRFLSFGQPLRGTLYPPRALYFDRQACRYVPDGHTQILEINSPVGHVHAPIDHDDRKPLSRWFQSQLKYAILEAEKLSATSSSEGLPDRVRRLIWPAVPAVFFYTLFVKRLILDGWPGLFYVLQRTFAEMVLSLVLLEKKLTFPKTPPKFS